MASKMDLAVKDVVVLLEKCVELGVLSLQWKDLNVSFSPPGERKGKPDTPAPAGEPAPPPLTAEQHEQNNQESLETEEERVKRDQLAHLMVEDPVEYERQIRDGELTDEPDDDESAGDEVE